MITPEIAEYPDSGKFGVFLIEGVEPDGRTRYSSFLGRRESSLDYWEGE
jgi:hypothetical protein